MTNNFSVFCSGPIKGLSYQESTDWRDYVSNLLPNNIHVLSPMRHKDFLSFEEKIDSKEYDHPLATPQGIVCRDRFDVYRCDMVLVNLLEAKEVSIGTMIEIGWSDAFRKPLCIVMEENNIHQHLIVRQCAGFIVPTLDEGIKIVKSVLL